MKKNGGPRRAHSRRRPEFEGQLCFLWGMVVVVFFIAIFVLFSGRRYPGMAPQKRAAHAGSDKLNPIDGRAAADDHNGVFFADKMVEILGTTQPFTLFAPSDAALRRLSSIFGKYPADKPKVDAILSRLVLYGAIPKLLPSKSIPRGGSVYTESLSGMRVLVFRRSKDQKLLANGVVCHQVDLARGRVVLHLTDGLVAPPEFHSVVAYADPQDLEREEREESEESEETAQTETGVAGHGELEVEWEEDPDVAEQKQAGGVAHSTRSQSEGAVGIVGSWIARNLRARVGSWSRAGPDGPEENSDIRNRDIFVREGKELLEPAEEGEVREQEDVAELEVEVGVNNDGKDEAEAGAREEGKGELVTRNRHRETIPGDSLFTEAAKNPKVLTGGLNMTASRKGGPASKALSSGEGAGDKEEMRATKVRTGNENDKGMVGRRRQDGEKEKNLENGGTAGETFWWMSSSLLGGGKAHASSTSEAVEPDGIETEEQSDEGRGVGGNVTAGGSMAAGTKDNASGLYLRGALPAAASPPLRVPQPCSGRGRIVGFDCKCTILFQGPNCSVARDNDDLAIDAYQGDLLMNSGQLSAVSESGADPASSILPDGKSTSRLGLSQKLAQGLTVREQKELKKVLPLVDPLGETVFDSCAVVGSSGSLLLQEMGEEIDMHDIVVRFNGAPTVGYQNHVGSKTSFRVSSAEWVGFREGNETVIYYLWMRAQNEELPDLLHFKRTFPKQGPLLIIDVGFVTDMYNALGLLPSPGYIGFALALQRCRRVNLYGFYLGEQHGVKYHYYDNKASSKCTDDLDREYEAAMEMADKELLWVANPCLYDCRQSVKRCGQCLQMPLSELSVKADWTAEQRSINARRDASWQKFQQWGKLEQEQAFLQAAQRKRKQARLKKLRKMAETAELGTSRNGVNAGIPWAKLVAEEALGTLAVGELLQYLREHHITVPPTKREMVKAVEGHFHFMNQHLEKHHSRVYVVSD